MSGINGPILIKIQNLTKHFPVRLGAFGKHKALVRAVDGVSFDIYKGETLGLVGESGCGKSTVGLTVLQLYRPTSGKILYYDTDLTQLAEKQLRFMRQKMQIIFQDPYSTMSPRMTIGAAIGEPIRVHKIVPKREVNSRVSSLLETVGLPPEYAIRYPHEFSGGQRQRVCIARALACDPEFIVCDEPISSLDISIRAQIINLFEELQAEYDLTYLFVAHDLSVVRHICDRVAVMYLGRLSELAPKDMLFKYPLHPYTKALLSAVPVPNPKQERERRRIILTGDVPSAIEPPSGCRFHPRCPLVTDLCTQTMPEWREVASGHFVACHQVA